MKEHKHPVMRLSPYIMLLASGLGADEHNLLGSVDLWKLNSVPLTLICNFNIIAVLTFVDISNTDGTAVMIATDKVSEATTLLSSKPNNLAIIHLVLLHSVPSLHWRSNTPENQYHGCWYGPTEETSYKFLKMYLSFTTPRIHASISISISSYVPISASCIYLISAINPSYRVCLGYKGHNSCCSSFFLWTTNAERQIFMRSAYILIYYY